MELGAHLVAGFDETIARWTDQVLDIVPVERQTERMPNGNSIAWAGYHVARHASLALQVLGVESLDADPRLRDFPEEASRPGNGLQEVQQPWAKLDPVAVRVYAGSVFEEVRAQLATMTPDALDERVDTAERLTAAGIDLVQYAWLLAQWDQPIGFLVRWPLTAHVIHHVGEMITTRNEFGLSPFR